MASRSPAIPIKRGLSLGTERFWDVAVRRNGDENFRRIISEHADVVGTIARNTEISEEHLAPGLKLFLLTPRCPLYHGPPITENGTDNFDDALKRTFTDPFWSIFWPGGQGLAKFILDENRRLFAGGKGNRVLDLGAGCGASAIAAKIAGARKVIANDIDQVACIAAVMNAVLNNVSIDVSRANLLRQPPEESYDTIFVGDLLYDEEVADTLIPWLEGVQRKNALIFLGDPGRHGLTDQLKRRLNLVRRYALPENVKRENNGYSTTSVWQFK